jgi:hypothetical protein
VLVLWVSLQAEKVNSKERNSKLLIGAQLVEYRYIICFVAEF